MITKLLVTSVSTKTDSQCANMLQSYNLIDSYCNIVRLVDIVSAQGDVNLSGTNRGNVNCSKYQSIYTKILGILS